MLRTGVEVLIRTEDSQMNNIAYANGYIELDGYVTVCIDSYENEEDTVKVYLNAYDRSNNILNIHYKNNNVYLELNGMEMNINTTSDIKELYSLSFKASFGKVNIQVNNI